MAAIGGSVNQNISIFESNSSLETNKIFKLLAIVGSHVGLKHEK